jgi:ABC-type sugar transport system ATPase subunit
MSDDLRGAGAANASGQGAQIAIGAQHVSKQFGHVTALRDASIQVHRGEIVALCGDNGAGKSTLLRVLQGIHRPDTGKVDLPAPLSPHKATISPRCT